LFEAHESRTTEIDAPIETVYGVITDFEKYPQWATSLKRVVIEDGSTPIEWNGCALPDEVEFFGGAIGFSVRYKLRYRYEPPAKLTWELTDGEIRGLLMKLKISSLDGSYEFESVDKGRTRATYTLRVALPMAIGPLRRKAEEIVMDTGLKDLKRRAEALAQKEETANNPSRTSGSSKPDSKDRN
jgi:uncharacterized protein YndB with AHSA1/START domain